jgi:hypothetical protein
MSNKGKRRMATDRQDRMVRPAHREAETTLPVVEEEKEPAGVTCPWCRTTGDNEVRKTYKSEHLIRRERICRSCARVFLTDERPAEHP